ncbi:MAG: 2-oxo-4-hydroxy-4-carboxy-5-ureidoimidazoline decarboxylase [Chloroflexota bacterium]|nr:2-oxo-4-hydroxy-4-carboxy-5-ureidoimidazoline decarboxylase [Chloroflexota bacterium]
MNLDRVNAWTADEARAEFRRCCGSARWAETMESLRPYASEAALLDAAERTWRDLPRIDRLEAFSAHPRIGDLDALRARFAATADWSAQEQGGVAGAPEEVLRGLVEGNRQYEERFGYLFLVCATGKSAAAMLELLRGRLSNDPDEEIANAAAEQAAIMRLRLERMG